MCASSRYINTLPNLTQLSGATETAASFQIDGEDHTLGNALRYIIHKKYVLNQRDFCFMNTVANIIYSPDVEFCGYSIPHPSEAKMNLRIQTYGKFYLIRPFDYYR
jgi:DNA-directed RNA polymerase I and III subunit RPAC2